MSDYLDGLYNERDHINESARMYLNDISRIADRAEWLYANGLTDVLDRIEKKLEVLRGTVDALTSVEQHIDEAEENQHGEEYGDD